MSVNSVAVTFSRTSSARPTTLSEAGLPCGEGSIWTSSPILKSVELPTASPGPDGMRPADKLVGMNSSGSLVPITEASLTSLFSTSTL